MQISNVEGQLSMFAPAGSAGKTFPAPSHREYRPARTSASSSKKYAELSAVPYLSLDLTPGAGNLLGISEWELTSPWRGASSTLNTGPAPRSAENVYTLSQILQDRVPRRYYLSKTACLGVLRRSEERGKPLPPMLEKALRIQAGLAEPESLDMELTAFAQNQRDEVRDLHNVAGALASQPGMKQQTYIAAGFSAGAGRSAGSIGYSEDVAPTLKSGQSGNSMPSVLCLNDQGGQRMDASEGVAGTLRSQDHGHAPLVFENHGIDARYRQLDGVAPTISARYGTGGNNVPLVEQEPAYCIAGNIIDREPQNGGNGMGFQADIAYTLTAMDKHAVFSRQRVDEFKPDHVASTESARQHKDATDLVVEPGASRLLIRRLTPLECERLQGFPDGWTEIPNASDSARYKALGNSVAIPCVEFVMRGIARVGRGE